MPLSCYYMSLLKVPLWLSCSPSGLEALGRLIRKLRSQGIVAGFNGSAKTQHLWFLWCAFLLLLSIGTESLFTYELLEAQILFL